MVIAPAPATVQLGHTPLMEVSRALAGSLIHFPYITIVAAESSPPRHLGTEGSRERRMVDSRLVHTDSLLICFLTGLSSRSQLWGSCWSEYTRPK